MLARGSALLIGTLALASLRAQFDAMPGQPVAQTLWLLAASFAVLTNLVVAAAMFAVARRWRIGSTAAAALVLSVVLVALFQGWPRLWHLEGAEWWAHFGLHIAVPLTVCVWWTAFAPKGVGLGDLPKLLLWPVTYAAYAVARGYMSGEVTVPFLNAQVLGLPVLALHLMGLLAVAAGLGAGLVGLARLLDQDSGS